MPACYRDTPQLRVKLYRSVCRIWRIASASTPYRKIICRVSIGSWDDGSSTWARSAFTAFTRFMASTDSVRARQPAPPPPLLRPLPRRCCPSGAASPSAPWARRLPAPLGAPTGLRAVHPSRSPVSIAGRGTLRAGLSWSGASRFLLSPLDVDDVETVDLLPSVSFNETALPRCFFSEISFPFLELESYLERKLGRRHVRTPPSALYRVFEVKTSPLSVQSLFGEFVPAMCYLSANLLSWDLNLRSAVGSWSSRAKFKMGNRTVKFVW